MDHIMHIMLQFFLLNIYRCSCHMVTYHYMYISMLIQPFSCWCTYKLFPLSCDGNQYCNKLSCSCIFKSLHKYTHRINFWQYNCYVKRNVHFKYWLSIAVLEKVASCHILTYIMWEFLFHQPGIIHLCHLCLSDNTPRTFCPWFQCEF